MATISLSYCLWSTTPRWYRFKTKISVSINNIMNSAFGVVQYVSYFSFFIFTFPSTDDFSAFKNREFFFFSGHFLKKKNFFLRKCKLRLYVTFKKKLSQNRLAHYGKIWFFCFGTKFGK